MLENLNDHICVSRFSGKEDDLWACYEPLSTQTKRQMWHRVTGLLSTSEMHTHLDMHYHDSQLVDQFDSISAKSLK